MSTAWGDTLRTVHLRPYAKGHGPTFTLRTRDTGRTDRLGKSILEYAFTMRENGKTVTLFEGADFACSPMHAIDSDAACASLLGFLTLRPGDTDREYFEEYTAQQLDYCSKHAEALSCAVMDRFGDH